MEEEAKAVGTGEYVDRTRICGWYSYSRVMKKNLKTQNSQLTDLVGGETESRQHNCEGGEGCREGAVTQHFKAINVINPDSFLLPYTNESLGVLTFSQVGGMGTWT